MLRALLLLLALGAYVPPPRALGRQFAVRPGGHQAAALASLPLRVRRWRISSKVVRTPVGSM